MALALLCMLVLVYYMGLAARAGLGAKSSIRSQRQSLCALASGFEVHAGPTGSLDPKSVSGNQITWVSAAAFPDVQI